MSTRFQVLAGSLLGAVAIHVILVACGSGKAGGTFPSKGAGDAAGEGTASAQSCLACTTAGVGRVMTADTDPAQLVTGKTGTLGANGAVVVTAGPFVLTFAGYTSQVTGGYGQLVMVAGADCSQATLGDGILLSDAPGSLSARILVPSGQTMCWIPVGGTRGAALVWSGFTPYAT
jgi:hypothetical protein